MYPELDPQTTRDLEEIEALGYGIQPLVVPGLHLEPIELQSRLASTIRPNREQMWGRVADDLAKKLPVEPITDRARHVMKRLGPDPVAQALDRLRDRRGARFADVEVLGVERSRIVAARREALAAVKRVVIDAVIPRNSLVDTFVKGLLDRVDLSQMPRLQAFVDRHLVLRALRSARLPPAVQWRPEIATALAPPEGAGCRGLAEAVEGVARGVQAERAAAAIRRATDLTTRARTMTSYHGLDGPGHAGRGRVRAGKTGGAKLGRGFFRLQ